MVVLNPMSFNNGAISAVLEFRRCTLVAIDTLRPAVTGNFSSAYLLQTKGAFLEFCRKTPGARNRAPFRYLQVSGFATDCPVLRFNGPQCEAGAFATIKGHMDVEKTIEFILEQQAKTESLWHSNEERWHSNEERWKRAEQRMDNFDQSLIRT
jgi:hypothetical protein